jgi:hypothetical protein
MLMDARRLARLRRWLCVVDGSEPAGPVKLVILPRTRIGLGRSGLRQHLETVHGPMVVSEPDVSSRFSGYVHHYVQDLAVPADMAILQDRDAVTIIRTPSMADLGLSKANAAYRDRISPDEDNFREVDGSLALLAEEFEVAPGVDDAACKLFIFRNAAPDRLDEWANKVGELVLANGLHGAVINATKTIEGQFPYSQFDEIGLPAKSDSTAIAAIIHQAALAHFGAVETSLLLAEPVRFI